MCSIIFWKTYQTKQISSAFKAILRRFNPKWLPKTHFDPNAETKLTTNFPKRNNYLEATILCWDSYTFLVTILDRSFAKTFFNHTIFLSNYDLKNRMPLIRGYLKFSDLLPKTNFLEKWTKPLTFLKSASDYPKTCAEASLTTRSHLECWMGEKW